MEHLPQPRLQTQFPLRCGSGGTAFAQRKSIYGSGLCGNFAEASLRVCGAWFAKSPRKPGPRTDSSVQQTDALSALQVTFDGFRVAVFKEASAAYRPEGN